MLKVTKLSYSFPQKDLYNKVTFSIEDDQHCAFIGTNGTGKSTLIDMIIHPDDYLYDGKIELSEHSRIGYVSQFSQLDERSDMTVFAYLSEEFVKLQSRIDAICKEMETAADIEPLMEEYQNAYDEFTAVDGDYYEVNIKKQLKLANLSQHENLPISKLSGGEFKLIQIIREMMISPKLMIMDEPDVFLDFEHLVVLRDMINAHKGTLLVITHNRYLLNHCFNKILHLENTEIQEFDGGYIEYNYTMLLAKIDAQEMAAADQEEIDRNRRIVERFRNSATAVDSATKGRSLKARVSLLERLEARKTKSPFVEIKQPAIHFAEMEEELTDEFLLEVEDYHVSFDALLLEHVDFALGANEKVAIIGPNGTGKTTLLREIFQNNHKAIKLSNQAKVAYLSQLQGETLQENQTLLEVFADTKLETEAEVSAYLSQFGFDEENINRQVKSLSGGEKNLLQLARIGLQETNLLLLDEPTSHLDTYAQIALEEAVAAYKGAVLMVSHDFYTVANCVDYVLLIEGNAIRKVSIRKFRKMIYANHFDKDYLEIEQKKKELENKIAHALQAGNFELAKTLSEDLEQIIKRLV